VYVLVEYEPVSLIFLAHNEAGTIEEEINTFYEKIISKIPGSEFIVAEDGSTDGTSEIIDRLSDKLGIIHLTSPERKGYIKAMADAVCKAHNNLIFISDTGLKHDAEDFWKLYTYREKYDLIVGRKTKRNDVFYRRFLTYIYNLFLRLYFKIPSLHDSDSGFRLFNKKVADKVFENKFIFTDLVGSEIVLRAINEGLEYGEVPVSYSGHKGRSRGLPLKRIPGVIIKVRKDLKHLKQEFKNNKQNKL